MSLEKLYQKTLSELNKYGQQHLLGFWGQMNDTEKTSLLNQIQDLELDLIPEWIEKYVKGDGMIDIPHDFEPCDYYPADPPANKEDEYKKARNLGEKLLRAGKVAAFVVAGGQGTRLGFDGPKGSFPVTPIRKKTLFANFAEILVAAGKKYNTVIPWYIMTSPLNNQPTINFFRENDYFGLGRENVIFFVQGTNPNFDFNGKILLSGKAEIAKSPDGHGGSLKALKKSGALADMKQRGIEHISYFQVDNPLIKIIDPLFIGLHAEAQAGMSSKTLKKAYPKEKVGNFCMVDNRVTVIEYSDLPDEQANRINPDGSLVFELGSIAIHIISTGFIEKINAHGFSLPIHKAIKKISYVDEKGKLVKPDEPNGVKLETFVFDALPMSEKSIILETIRLEEFAPVKNATGPDSPEVTHQMMIERAAKWLQQAGVDVPKDSHGKPDCIIEMAPSFAIFPEDVKDKLEKMPDIRPGNSVYLE